MKSICKILIYSVVIAKVMAAITEAQLPFFDENDESESISVRSFSLENETSEYSFVTTEDNIESFKSANPGIEFIEVKGEIIELPSAAFCHIFHFGNPNNRGSKSCLIFISLNIEYSREIENFRTLVESKWKKERSKRLLANFKI